jgi:hypothetical protein
MRAQLPGLLDATREYREGTFHRLDEHRVVEIPGNACAIALIQAGAAKVGIGRNLRQYASRMQLVLRRQDAFRSCAGQSEPLGHQRRGECAELLVMG